LAHACSRGVDVRYEHVRESDNLLHVLAALSTPGAQGHREKERLGGKAVLLFPSPPDVILARGLLQHLPLPLALEVPLSCSSFHRHATPYLPSPHVGVCLSCLLLPASCFLLPASCFLLPASCSQQRLAAVPHVHCRQHAVAAVHAADHMHCGWSGSLVRITFRTSLIS